MQFTLQFVRFLLPFLNTGDTFATCQMLAKFFDLTKIKKVQDKMFQCNTSAYYQFVIYSFSSTAFLFFVYHKTSFSSSNVIRSLIYTLLFPFCCSITTFPASRVQKCSIHSLSSVILISVCSLSWLVRVFISFSTKSCFSQMSFFTLLINLSQLPSYAFHI